MNLLAKTMIVEGFSPRQALVLELLNEKEMTAAEMKSELLHPVAITGIIDKLVNLGLVRRTRSTTDRRKIMLGLTDKGRRFFAWRTRNHHKPNWFCGTLKKATKSPPGQQPKNRFLACGWLHASMSWGRKAMTLKQRLFNTEAFNMHNTVSYNDYNWHIVWACRFGCYC